MPSRFIHSLHIGLSKTGVALVQRHGWLRPKASVLAESPALAARAESHELVLHRLRILLTDSGCSALAATVVVANDWARYFIVTPPRNALRLQDCQAAAELRFQTLFGEAANGWQIEADWDARHPFLACAMPHPLLTGLQQIAAEYRLRLTSVQPHFTVAWNRWRHQLPPDAWFGTIHAQGLTVAICQQKRLLAARTLALPAAARHDRRSMMALLAREALRLNLPAPARIHLAGQVPVTWPARGNARPACKPLESDQTVLPGSPVSEAVMLATTQMTP